MPQDPSVLAALPHVYRVMYPRIAKDSPDFVGCVPYCVGTIARLTHAQHGIVHAWFVRVETVLRNEVEHLAFHFAIAIDAESKHPALRIATNARQDLLVAVLQLHLPDLEKELGCNVTCTPAFAPALNAAK